MNYKEDIVSKDTYKITLKSGKTFYYKANNNNMGLSNIVIRDVKNLNDKSVNDYKVSPSQVLVLVDDYDEMQEIIEALKYSLMKNYLTNMKSLKTNVTTNDEGNKQYLEEVLKNEDVPYNIVDNELYEENENTLDKDNTATVGGDSSIINTESDGISKEYVSYENGIYEENAEDLEIEKKTLFEELIKDPLVKDMLLALSPLERDKILMDRIMANKTKHDLNKPNEETKENDVKGAAQKTDGIYNEELGIIQNGVESENKYTAIEENKGQKEIVNPEVYSMEMSSYGNTNANVDISANTNSEVVTSYKSEQVRDIEKTFYYDSENNIYDGDKIIGKVGMDGYSINPEDNSLMKDNTSLGFLDILGNNMDNSLEQKNVKKKVLTKPEQSDDNSAFINIYGILGIILILTIIILLILFNGNI